MQTLTIRRPDDWHVHLRDGEMLRKVAPYTARQFARAIAMPNLVPPITTVEAAAAYRDRITAAAGADFTPLMTCYLTDQADPDELARGYADGVWVAAKLYPAGATTNSAGGVTDIRNIYPALERMQAIGMILCVHGEVTDPEVDVFDREAVFIDRLLSGIFDAPFALESYAAVFEKEGALDRFEDFASVNGARFYGLPLNEGNLTLEKADTEVPEEIDGIVPFHAGETLRWRLVA